MMRRLAVLVCAAVLAGCTTSNTDGGLKPDQATTFSTIDVDWPASDVLDAGDPPPVPDGFDADRYAQMADTLQSWAQASTLSPQIRRSDDPVADVGLDLPGPVASRIRDYADAAVTPRLSAANVFAKDVEVVGKPRSTTAWQADVVEEDGEPALQLDLQTRAAYEVRLGDGPTRVIGVLRTHRLITRQGASGDVGVGYAWQEFGASDCTVATDDALRPDGGSEAALEKELRTFVEVGDGDTVEMPKLASNDQLDDAFIERCRFGSA